MIKPLLAVPMLVLAAGMIAADTTESFKWSDGHPEAMLVRAKMDWKTFSVGRFEGIMVDGDGNRTLRNTMDADNEKRRVFGRTRGYP